MYFIFAGMVIAYSSIFLTIKSTNQTIQKLNMLYNTVDQSEDLRSKSLKEFFDSSMPFPPRLDYGSPHKSQTARAFCEINQRLGQPCN